MNCAVLPETSRRYRISANRSLDCKEIVRAPRAPMPVLPGTRTLTLPGVRGVPSRDAQRDALRAAGQSTADSTELLGQILAIAVESLQDVYHLPLSSVAYVVQAYGDYAKGAEAQYKDLATKTNPFLADLVIPGRSASVQTKSYLTTRRWKKVGGYAVQTAGNLMSLSPITGHVNPLGVAYHGHAALLTLRHEATFARILATLRSDPELAEIIPFLLYLKSLKAAVRSGQSLGSALPAASLPAGLFSAVTKIGVKISVAGACYAVAAKLHWLAYAEAQPAPTRDAADASRPCVPNFSRPLPPRPTSTPTAASGPTAMPNFSYPLRPLALTTSEPNDRLRSSELPQPVRTACPASAARRGRTTATRVVHELFAKRGATFLFGRYDVDSLIMEPAGWLAIADKLLLI